MLAFLQAHWDGIVAVVTAVVVVAREVVKFTASTKDDAIEQTVETVLNKFGLIKADAVDPTSTPPAPPAA